MDTKKSKKKPIIIFVSIVLVLCLLGFVFSSVSVNVSEDSRSNKNISSGEDFVAVLNVNGTISSSESGLLGDNSYDHKFTLDSIENLKGMENNKGIFLFVNTPGGGVYESDELYVKLKEYQKETKRPVYAYFAATAASGGYYISANADKIIANRNTLTGSIGVTIGTIFDLSGFMNKHGIKHETITAGNNKAMGSPVEKLTKEQKKIYQSIVDESYNQFVNIVAKGRDMSVGEAKKIADGRVYTAKQAKAKGLVDHIATKEEAISMMKDDMNLAGIEFITYKPNEQTMFDKIFASINLKKTTEFDQISKVLSINEDQGGLKLEYKMKN
ncbi:MAG: signal peptide peptidase SppA [Anaerovoracaceae bacterium]